MLYITIGSSSFGEIPRIFGVYQPISAIVNRL